MKRLGAEVFGVELPLPKDLDLDGEWAPETVNCKISTFDNKLDY